MSHISATKENQLVQFFLHVQTQYLDSKAVVTTLKAPDYT